MKRNFSLKRRLIATVLILESLSAVALIEAITGFEHHSNMEAFDFALKGTADSILGVVQDAKDEVDHEMLRPGSMYRVTDESGRVIGALGVVPVEAGTQHPQFKTTHVDHHTYRWVTFSSIRTIDRGKAGEGVRHLLTITYGRPTDHVWHEVFEAVRFFAATTIILLGFTTALLIWLLRRGLHPLTALAAQAEHVDAASFDFHAPESAQQVDELRPLAHALEETFSRLREAMEQQKRFTSDAAHELKTDVAIVKSSLQLLIMKHGNDSKNEDLRETLNDLKRLESTVQKMLTLSRLESDAAQASRSNTSLLSAVEESVAQLKPVALLRDVALLVTGNIEASIGLTREDAVILLNNVILNAIQHSHPEGSVEIYAESDSQKIRLQVYDRGDGIPPDHLARLFQPFYRPDASRSRESGSTGLGLSICRAICNRAGGSIRIENREGGGTTVTIELPLQ